jgi:hypothetical protein
LKQTENKSKFVLFSISISWSSNNIHWKITASKASPWSSSPLVLNLLNGTAYEDHTLPHLASSNYYTLKCSVWLRTPEHSSTACTKLWN